MHPSLLPTLKLFFVFFSFVLYGVACAGLVTDELRGDPAMALVAFAGGVGCWVVVLMMFLAHSKPDKWIATTWFDLATSSTLFVFLTAGLAQFTSDTSPLLTLCRAPPALTLRPSEFDLLCTLTTTVLAVGWLSWALLTLEILVTLLLVGNRWWKKDGRGIVKMPVGVLWSEGWWKGWEKPVEVMSETRAGKQPMRV